MKYIKSILGISIILAIISVLLGCSSNLKSVVRMPKLKFSETYNPYQYAVDSKRLRSDGVYVSMDNDSLRPSVYFYFEPDGECYEMNYEAGIYNVCGDSLEIQTYWLVRGWPKIKLGQGWCPSAYKAKIIDNENFVVTKYWNANSYTQQVGPDKIWQDVCWPYRFIQFPEPVGTNPVVSMRQYPWMWKTREDFQRWKKSQSSHGM